MNFDPIKDYYGIDITINENLIVFKFWEFIKNLVTLSSDSETQKEIIGFGAVADEMAIDFETYFTLESENYLKFNLLTHDLISDLSDIDTFLEIRSGDQMPEFWDDDLLNSHPDWEVIREMAKCILKTMNFDDLEIKIERSTKYGRSFRGKRIISEATKTRLAKKSSKSR